MVIETAKGFFEFAQTLNADRQSPVNVMLFDSYRMLESNPKVISHLDRFYEGVPETTQNHV